MSGVYEGNIEDYQKSEGMQPKYTSVEQVAYFFFYLSLLLGGFYPKSRRF